jgi:hypothetical protein
VANETTLSISNGESHGSFSSAALATARLFLCFVGVLAGLFCHLHIFVDRQGHDSCSAEQGSELIAAEWDLYLYRNGSNNLMDRNISVGSLASLGLPIHDV